MPDLGMVRLHQRLERRRDVLSRWERRTGSWIQGWILIVVILFVGKWLSPHVPWMIVAVVAGGQTVLTAMLIVINTWRWRTELRRRDVESKISAD